MRCLALATCLLALPIPALAQDHDHGNHSARSAYAGEERRDIKSLSDEDIATLRRGGGWEFAKPAELNGIPGPIHVLEMREELSLTPEQASLIEAIYEGMRSAAIAEGERLISHEQALEQAFRIRAVDDLSLRKFIADSEASRAALRFIHLSAHLRMPAVLSPPQIEDYNRLRGYEGE